MFCKHLNHLKTFLMFTGFEYSYQRGSDDRSSYHFIEADTVKTVKNTQQISYWNNHYFMLCNGKCFIKTMKNNKFGISNIFTLSRLNKKFIYLKRSREASFRFKLDCTNSTPTYPQTGHLSRHRDSLGIFCSTHFVWFTIIMNYFSFLFFRSIFKKVFLVDCLWASHTG